MRGWGGVGEWTRLHSRVQGEVPGRWPLGISLSAPLNPKSTAFKGVWRPWASRPIHFRELLNPKARLALLTPQGRPWLPSNQLGSSQGLPGDGPLLGNQAAESLEPGQTTQLGSVLAGFSLTRGPLGPCPYSPRSRQRVPLSTMNVAVLSR